MMFGFSSQGIVSHFCFLCIYGGSGHGNMYSRYRLCLWGLLLVLLLVPDVGYRYLTYSKDRRENAPEPVVSEPAEVSDATPKLD